MFETPCVSETSVTLRFADREFKWLGMETDDKKGIFKKRAVIRPEYDECTPPTIPLLSWLC